jgi:hypothetical protein
LKAWSRKRYTTLTDWNAKPDLAFARRKEGDSRGTISPTPPPETRTAEPITARTIVAPATPQTPRPAATAAIAATLYPAISATSARAMTPNARTRSAINALGTRNASIGSDSAMIAASAPARPQNAPTPAMTAAAAVITSS